LAADQGLASGQFNLGVMYRNGTGVDRDFAQAAHWYRQAAHQGHPSAQYHLAVLLVSGDGVDADYAKAASWFRRAAIQGSADAQYELGLMNGHGAGVAQNLELAYMWLDIAAQGASNARRGRTLRTRDEFAARMSPGQLARAREAVQACLASSYQNCGPDSARH
ncbi:MAG TPA: tetratricopeptide repeat protein, partial [Kineobactrum sp.]